MPRNTGICRRYTQLAKWYQRVGATLHGVSMRPLPPDSVHKCEVLVNDMGEICQGKSAGRIDTARTADGI